MEHTWSTRQRFSLVQIGKPGGVGGEAKAASAGANTGWAALPGRAEVDVTMSQCPALGLWRPEGALEHALRVGVQWALQQFADRHRDGPVQHRNAMARNTREQLLEALGLQHPDRPLLRAHGHGSHLGTSTRGRAFAVR
jgi:hypothetical protein